MTKRKFQKSNKNNGTNKHIEKHEEKELGPTDELVKEIFEKSMETSK